MIATLITVIGTALVQVVAVVVGNAIEKKEGEK